MFSCPTEYKNELVRELDELVFIMFDDGFKKNCSRSIDDVLTCIRKLSTQYPEVHNKIISANARYGYLYETFPEWQDVNNLQRARELKAFIIR